MQAILDMVRMIAVFYLLEQMVLQLSLIHICIR